MPFPRLPGKHRWDPLFSAVDFWGYVARRERTGPPRVPPNLVLVFGARWNDYLRHRFRGRYEARPGVYRLGRSVGVAQVQGPGAPFASMVVEELAGLGARSFLLVGLAGSLQLEIRVGSMVVCTKALRDEGTSYHYARPAAFAVPDRELTASLGRSLRLHGVPFVRGPSWTTDAPYRETVPEIRRYRRTGIVTVEMEASAVFTVARALGRKAAALFVVSDHLDERGWEPRFSDTHAPLHEALEIALGAYGSARARRSPRPPAPSDRASPRVARRR